MYALTYTTRAALRRGARCVATTTTTTAAVAKSTRRCGDSSSGSSNTTQQDDTSVVSLRAPSNSTLPYRHGLGLDIAALSALDNNNNKNNEGNNNNDNNDHTQTVCVRGRVDACRRCGGVAFVRLRQPSGGTLQVVCAGRALARRVCALLTPESVVDVRGQLRRARAPVTSTTCATYELHADVVQLVGAAAATPLPFPLHDAHTRLDTRLAHRVVDLRTRATAAVVRVASFVCGQLHAELRRAGFVEVHTPKLVAAASEMSNNNDNNNNSSSSRDDGTAAAASRGSAMFVVDYFGRCAYLAQSPQLYKQMLVQGDVPRVYEVAPVFRAENSLTHRHLTEFVGVDVEMLLERSYTEILDVLERVLCNVLYAVQASDGDGDGGNNNTTHASSLPASPLQLLQAAHAALREQCDRSSGDDDDDDDDDTAAADAAVWQRIVCEVPDDVMQRYNLAYDDDDDDDDDDDGADDSKHNDNDNRRSDGTASRDDYHARVGGSRRRRRRDNAAAVDAPARVLRLSFDDAVRLLRDHAATRATTNDDMSSSSSDTATTTTSSMCAHDVTDFSLAQEKQLGQLVKARYGVDLYVIDAFPLASRPFYTMPKQQQQQRQKQDGQQTTTTTTTTTASARSCSFDVYLRGEEVASGAQRVHDAAMLRQRIAAAGVDATALRDYVAAFAYGAWPHGGAGFGLERIVQFLLDAHDIRRVSLFPRDPRRLAP